MPTLLVANPKGGSGKTTLTTNIAGYLAASGHAVALLDLDRQQSATRWLENRDSTLPVIYPLGATAKPGHTDWLLIDSPAGLHGKNLDHALRLADLVIVPIAPSLFDIQASQDFLSQLALEKPVKKGRAVVGVVGMRMDPRTRSAATLEGFLETTGLPILAYLRETQAYINAAFEGKSLFDLPHHMAERELEQWTYMLDWLNAFTPSAPKSRK